MINISNIKKTFYSGLGEEKSVFNGLNLEINQGDFISVIGSNGAGKTTLINTISGNIDLDDGYIEVDGKNINNLAKHKRGEFISKVYQNPAMGTAPSMTIFENLSMADNKGKRFGLSLGLNYSRKGALINISKSLDYSLLECDFEVKLACNKWLKNVDKINSYIKQKLINTSIKLNNSPCHLGFKKALLMVIIEQLLQIKKL